MFICNYWLFITALTIFVVKRPTVSFILVNYALDQLIHSIFACQFFTHKGSQKRGNLWFEPRFSCIKESYHSYSFYHTQVRNVLRKPILIKCNVYSHIGIFIFDPFSFKIKHILEQMVSKLLKCFKKWCVYEN